MLFGISFTARPGKEAELEQVLAEPGVIRLAAERMGASLEAVFVQGSRFTQVFDLPDAATPGQLRERILRAHDDPEVRALLRRAAPLLDDPFEPEDPTSFAAFVQRHRLKVVVDARPAEQGGAAKASFRRVAIGAAPR